MAEENGTAGVMPIGNNETLPIREEQVTTTEGAVAPPVFDDDAVCTLVWANYNLARNYVENNAWLLEWQETDILYQSPIPNRFIRVESGRPPRVPDFLVAKLARTQARAVKKALFAEQIPFLLRPTGKTTQAYADAWTELIMKLLKRMKFQYKAGLLIDCQVLQGTGIGKLIWEERTVKKSVRKRKKMPPRVNLPAGTEDVPTIESDEFEVEEVEVTESWPCFEYRRLGWTLFDPKWSTPDHPEESAGYAIDIDYVNFEDLQRLRQLECYKNIPDEATLKKYFFERMEGSAPIGSQIEDSMSSQGSMVIHADARNRLTDKNPLEQQLLLLEQWDEETVKTILVYEGRKLTIRNDTHVGGRIPQVTATWWPIDNSGYGMGVGRINGPDQRVRAGVKNESLKTIAYPFNAPLVYTDEQNAPTQNVIARMGGYWCIRGVPPGGDFNKAVGFLKMPDVPPDAWKMLQFFTQEGEQMSGASQQFQQGNIGGPGSSAARTATGASRIASQSDQSVADPVESFAEGVIVPTIEFLITMVKEKMPLQEIRDMISEKHAAVIEKAIDEEQFLNAEFEVSVLAGQKLAAKQGIQQLIPMLLQITQQPQLLEYLHQRGETIDFGVMMDLMLQVSELQQQPDIFRPLNEQEKQMLKQMNPGAQKIQQAVTTEQLKGKNKLDAINAQGQVDLGNKAAEIAMEHTAEGIPLIRAEGLLERGNDERALAGGLPDTMQE